MLYEMLTGHTPLEGRTPQQVLRHHIIEADTPLDALVDLGLPAPMQGVLERLLAKDAAERFLTAEELVAACEQALDGPTTRGREVPPQDTVQIPSVASASISQEPVPPSVKQARDSIEAAAATRISPFRRWWMWTLAATGVLVIMGVGAGVVAMMGNTQEGLLGGAPAALPLQTPEPIATLSPIESQIIATGLGTNLAPDPSFEIGRKDWIGKQGGSVSTGFDRQYAKDGFQSLSISASEPGHDNLSINRSVLGAGITEWPGVISPAIAVNPAESHLFTVWAYTPDIDAPARALLGVQLYDTAGNPVNMSIGMGSIPIVPKIWVPITLTVPAEQLSRPWGPKPIGFVRLELALPLDYEAGRYPPGTRFRIFYDDVFFGVSSPSRSTPLPTPPSVQQKPIPTPELAVTTITEVGFTDGIHHGIGVMTASQQIDFGTGKWQWSHHSDAGTGYFYGPPELAFANLTPTSPCDSSYPGYFGYSSLGDLTDVSGLNYEVTNAMVFGINASSCFMGLLVFRQGAHYGVIEPLTIDKGEPNYFGYLADAALTFYWWYGEPGVTDFSMAPPRTLSIPHAMTRPVLTRPILSGKIAFISNIRNEESIWVMSPDGSSGSRFTPYSAYSASDPSWSSDGTRLAFASNRDGNWDIYVVNGDGSNETRLTNNPAFDGEPAWSPDGTKMVFTSGRSGEGNIYIVNIDGSNETRLTYNNAFDGEPSWSPDSTKIVFTSHQDGNQDIYVMNADGSNPVRLTNHPAFDGEPAWSPDGTKIVFTSNRDGNREIYVMNANGSNPVGLTNNLAIDEEPSWSPDSTKIIFASHRDGNKEIYTMNADGAEQRSLTRSPGLSEYAPSWGKEP